MEFLTLGRGGLKLYYAGHMYRKKADGGKCPRLSILGREDVRGELSEGKCPVENMSRGKSPTPVHAYIICCVCSLLR